MWGNAAMSAADMSGSGDGIKAALRAERSYARLAYTDDWIAAMSSSRPPTSMLKSVTTFRWHQAQPNTAPGLQAAWPRAEMIDVRFPRSGAVALTLAALALYFLRVDDIAGLIGDDAWYMVLAKAISEGSAPRLISSAGTEFLSNVYPPGFPAILSLVFLISPQFPENVVLLKGISIAAMIGAEPEANLGFMGRNSNDKRWIDNIATDAEMAEILRRIREGLDEGGIGIGILNAYAPGAGVKEMSAVCSLAAEYDVPTYTHVAYASNIDPKSSIEAYTRFVGYAGSTGAHMHICHFNSTSLQDVERAAALIRKAQELSLLHISEPTRPH